VLMVVPEVDSFPTTFLRGPDALFLHQMCQQPARGSTVSCLQDHLHSWALQPAQSAAAALVYAVQRLLPSKLARMHIVKRCTEQRQQSSKCLPIDIAGPAVPIYCYSQQAGLSGQHWSNLFQVS